VEREWRLHPLIHTLLEFNLTQDVENCQASDIRKREPPSTRPNMPMGDEEMKFGSDDPLGSSHLKPIMLHYGVGTVTIL